MKRLTLGIMLHAMLMLYSPGTWTQTVIPEGDVSGTWDVSGSPYQVTGNINIPDGASLEVEAGCLIEFQGFYSLQVQGRLLAEGTMADTIVFTVNDTTGFFDPAAEAGGWNSIRFTDTPQENDSSIIHYCKFQYGKAVGDVWHLNAGGALCAINFGKIRISHCLFLRNSAGGSYDEVPAGGAIHAAWSDIALYHNAFMHNRARTGGAIQLHESAPRFVGNIFYGNEAETGGAVACGGPVELSFQDDQFINNTATSHGGGLMCWSADSASFTGVTFTGNTADWGGGLGITGTATTIDACIFNDNLALNIGGGMAADYCDLTIHGSLFVHDSSASISGGLHNWHCTTTISNSEFTDNAAVLGGAIYSDFSTASMAHVLFSDNTAEYGGALRYWCSDLALENVLFIQNHAYAESGALEFRTDTNEFSKPYELTLFKSQFIENTAANRFGAAFIQQSNTDIPITNVLIDSCEFTDNQAERIGAIQISGSISGTTISNSHFDRNSSTLLYGCASFVGGASGKAFNTLFTFNQAGSGTAGAAGIANMATFDFINCTFAGNASPAGGAISLRRGSSSILLNSIFWGNSPNQLVMNAITDSTPCTLNIYHCDVQDGQDSIIVLDTTTSIIQWGTGNITSPPLFEDTLSNDFHLRNSSPCIGSGIDSLQINGSWYFAPAADMEGHPRPDPAGSAPDMGIFESPLGSPMDVRKDSLNTIRPLLRIRPNPFSGRTMLEFTLKYPARVGFDVYNAMGEKVMSLPELAYPAGIHNLEWVPLIKEEGMYYVVIHAANRQEIKKAVLIR